MLASSDAFDAYSASLWQWEGRVKGSSPLKKSDFLEAPTTTEPVTRFGKRFVSTPPTKGT